MANQSVPKITLLDVEKLREAAPRRRCFADTAECANTDGSHRLALKFDSVANLFGVETGLRVLGGPHGPWCKAETPDEVERLLKWKEKVGKWIFLRDALELSMALDFNFAQEGVYTELGLAEHQAKGSKHEPSVEQLHAALVVAIGNVAHFEAADCVCAVPPAKGKDWDLPTELAKRVSASCGKPDLSSALKFESEKKSVKTLSLAEKWASLEAAGLQVSSAVKGKKVLLIDDKYQSGTTAQFVASKLYDAGTEGICGLFCVKTWRDTDNT